MLSVSLLRASTFRSADWRYGSPQLLCTDADQHRRLPADTELAQSITVLARAHQDATWRRTRASNELRSLLREYFPGFLHTFADRPGAISSPEARAVLASARPRPRRRG
jgi:hypothetical protein